MVAITPHRPEFSRETIGKYRLTFDMLSDRGNEYAAKLGLRFRIPDDVKAEYEAMGLDLPRHNGDDSWTLPMPGRFVIDQHGIVRVVDVDPDYTRRPEPEKTIQDLKAIT